MKKTFSLVVGAGLILAASASFAATKTNLTNNWICTTNASSAATDVDKAADDKMAKTAASAAKAYAYAAQNCRDCTKITCEAQANQ
ncbi:MULTISPECIES: hypothetical protein [Legionella]|uniref:Uncharacterized protein n=1 Tax=Legionella drozanskii LLAP-1 TaxID=1212489 RepID=A0A0W0SWL8_9GAMM|nr:MULTISPECIES: hypothetical protein [Legionella]KTC87697.1 hypothetical protein Ldro_1316 [Legionella drozanskii LLAP-1]PJE16231.1 MAG: hypothetical protein CK430_03360 [Legionella sp.]